MQGPGLQEALRPPGRRLLRIWKNYLAEPILADGETCARPLGSLVRRLDMDIPVPGWTQGVRVGSLGTTLAQGEAVRARGGRVLQTLEKLDGWRV